MLLKREDLQPIFSFKIRGAYNRIARLLGARRGRGASSAPRPATTPRASRSSAQRLGIEAVIVMPVTTPPIKVDAVRYWGGKVVLHGDTFDEAYAQARRSRRSGA